MRWSLQQLLLQQLGLCCWPPGCAAAAELQRCCCCWGCQSWPALPAAAAACCHAGPAAELAAAAAGLPAPSRVLHMPAVQHTRQHNTQQGDVRTCDKHCQLPSATQPPLGQHPSTARDAQPSTGDTQQGHKAALQQQLRHATSTRAASPSTHPSLNRPHPTPASPAAAAAPPRPLSS